MARRSKWRSGPGRRVVQSYSESVSLDQLRLPQRGQEAEHSFKWLAEAAGDLTGLDSLVTQLPDIKCLRAQLNENMFGQLWPADESSVLHSEAHQRIVRCADREISNECDLCIGHRAILAGVRRWRPIRRA